MISKERLETLIKEGATIYEVKYNNINPVSLKNKIRFIHRDVIVFEPRPDEKYQHHKYLKNLFETLEEAEWHKEFGCIERVERLVLPTWEEIENTINRFCYFTDCYGRECCLSYQRATNKVKLKYWVGVGDGEEEFECGVWEFTKENYTLACRKCKELFLGGSDEQS